MAKAKKRAREVVPSHCHTCGQSMDQMACHIDWHAVYVGGRVTEFMIEKRLCPSHSELVAKPDCSKLQQKLQRAVQFTEKLSIGFQTENSNKFRLQDLYTLSIKLLLNDIKSVPDTTTLLTIT